MKIPLPLRGIRVIRGIRGQKKQPRITQISRKPTIKAIFIRSGEPQDHGNLVVSTDSSRSPPRIQDTKNLLLSTSEGEMKTAADLKEVEAPSEYVRHAVAARVKAQAQRSSQPHHLQSSAVI